MTFDIGLHEVCVRVGVLYVITKFSRMDSLPNFVTHGAPLRALRARELRYKRYFPRITIKKIDKSFFAGIVRKMLIISGERDCIVLHCLYFLQHKPPVYNCSSDTAMSRPFPHSCEQRHQVQAWMEKIQ